MPLLYYNSSKNQNDNEKQRETISVTLSMLSTTTKLKKGKAPLSQAVLPVNERQQQKYHALQFILQCFVYLVLNDS